MRLPFRSLVVGALLPIFVTVALAQSGEEQALKEMFFAKSAAEVAAHLPEVVRKAALELSPADRAAFESHLLIRKEICERAKCTAPSDGHALLVVKPEDGSEGQPAMEVRLKRR